MDEGLPHSDVNAIVQDCDGFLWVATFSGLSKWDGYRIKTFRTDNSALSSDRVLSLFVASDSLLYIGTESGKLNRYDPITEKITVIDDSEESTASDRMINDLFQDQAGTVWVCRNDGLGYVSKHEENGMPVVKSRFRWRGHYIQSGIALDSCRLLLSTDDGPVIYDTKTDETETVFRDYIRSHCFSIRLLADGNIALTGGWGVYLYRPATQELRMLCPNSSRVVTKDSRGNLWVGSFDRGLYKYDGDGNQLAHYHPKLPRPHATGSFEISALLEDRSGVLWIGTIGGGLNRMNIVEKQIKCFTEAQELSENRVITFLETGDGTLWVSTHGGIDLFDRTTEKFRKLRINGQPSISFGVVSAFFSDDNGDIWLGTWDKGLWIIKGQTVADALARGQARAYQVRHPLIEGALSVFRIVKDRDGHLWISTNRGCFEYIPPRTQDQMEQWINYTHDSNDYNSLSSDFATDIYADAYTKRKTIWVGTRLGLNKIVFDNNGESYCQRIDLMPSPTHSEHKKRGAFVSAIHCDRKGDLWIASIGGGLLRMTEGRFDEVPPRFERFDTSNTQLFNNELESLQEDDHGIFWIGGYGISRFDPSSHSIRHYTAKDRLQSNSFKIWASYKLRDGELVFGGVNGFNIFHPDSIADNNIRPYTTISRLKVRNQAVCAGDTLFGKSVLPRAINHLNRLELSYRCNNLTFEFTTFAYVEPEYNKFRYRLENFDTDWNYTDGKSPQAIYTNLRSGSYKLTVYGSNEDGIWSDSPAELEIVIRPPVYATRIAYLCYVLLAVLFIYGWHRRSLKKLQERHQIELERNKYYEEQKSSANMLQFYTDIAHELKTPLSLIAAPVDELLMNPHIGETTRNRLKLVNRNTSALTALLEQILDLRKYENHKMKLSAVETDVSRFLAEIAELFKPLADNLRIRFSVECPQIPVYAWIDCRKMQTAVVNMLYNAFKYTPKGSGKVILSCEQDDNSVFIRVKDNGIGISVDEQTRIFERFYQARNNNATQKSVGIGLALSKYIVGLHHGEIGVESELHAGSVFYIRLSRGSAHLTPEQLGDSDSEQKLASLPKSIENELAVPEITPLLPPEVDRERSISVLVVEDNVALRDYLRSALQNRYRVYTAGDGESAYDMAVSEQPDLILSDIVMPGINGIELCRRIKQNTATSHISVVLLTAHNLLSHEISGYRVGADSYIAKPFSLEVLFSRIDSLIVRQDKIRETYHSHVEVSVSDVPVERAEDKFLCKCTEVVENRMSDPQFDVQRLSRETGVSRSLLYRRILAITGLTPVQFIRNIRLKHAAQLFIKDGTLSVSEVMYQVGYTNPSHFAKIFHGEFGLYPKEFALKNKNRIDEWDDSQPPSDANTGNA